MWENFKAFWRQPYEGAAEMDVLDWAKFIGLVLVFVIIWSMIFRHIIEGITE